MPPKVTMRDVAKKLNISVNSVSLALNNKPEITESLRKEILKTCKELGYDIAKITNKNGTGGNIGFLIRKDFMLIKGESFYTKIFHAAMEEAEKGSYHILLDSLSKEEIQNLTPPSFLDKEIKGILIAGYIEKEYILFLKKTGIPIVLLDYDIIDPPMDMVDCENLMGADLAVTYLISKGHRNIALVCGALEYYTSLLRMQGYNLALYRSQIPLNSEIMIEKLPPPSMGGKTSVELAYDATLNLLKSYQGKIDAFFCVKDVYAIGCMKAVKELGYRVPDDISVIGFDNLDLAEHLTPPLTTVNIPVESIGREGIKRVLELVDAKNKKIEETPKRILLPVQLIIRDTVQERTNRVDG